MRAILPGIINSVVGDLATDPSFTAAITAEVRRTTFRVAEAVLFDDDVPLPPAFCAILEAATEGALERMEVAEEPKARPEHSGDGVDKGDLTRL